VVVVVPLALAVVDTLVPEVLAPVVEPAGVVVAPEAMVVAPAGALAPEDTVPSITVVLRQVASVPGWIVSACVNT